MSFLDILRKDAGWTPELEKIVQKELPNLDLSNQVKFDDKSKRVSSGFSNVTQGTWKDKEGKETKVAVKMLEVKSGWGFGEDRLIKRLLREIIAWKSIKGDHIVPLFGFIRRPIALISPWYEEGTVLEFLERNPDVNRYHLFLDVARGLDALHPTLVHGDIKAQNVLVTKEGKAVLCDFGSSRVQDALAVPRGLTTANDSTATTVLFRSPELLGSKNPVPTLASDIWAMGCLAIQIIVNRPPWAHYGIESHIESHHFAPEAIKGDMPLESKWRPGTLEEKNWWKVIKQRCWKLDPEERCTAKKLLEDGIKMVTRNMDPFLMGHILTKACTVAGRKISEFVLEREYGLPKDALCAEVIEAAVKRNKSFANWKMFTLAIQTKDEDKEPQRLRLWTDCPFEIYEKWDPKERPRFLFKIIKEHSPFEPEPHCGIEEWDNYSTVLTRVLDAHGVDGDRSEYILIIKCGDNGEEHWVAKNHYPWYRFKELEEEGRSPRFSFFRESARPTDTPTWYIIRKFGEDENRDYTITSMVHRASEYQDSTVSLETGLFAIAVIPLKSEEVKIDSCYRVDRDGEDAFVGRLLMDTRSECFFSARPTECLWTGFLRLKVHPFIAILNSQPPSPSPPKRTFFKTYLPLKLEYLDDKELQDNIIFTARENYIPTRDYELRLRRGDELIGFIIFRHWRFVIKVADGERGWVPGWKIVVKSSPTPATTEELSKESTDTAKDEKPSESTSS